MLKTRIASIVAAGLLRAPLLLVGQGMEMTAFRIAVPARVHEWVLRFAAHAKRLLALSPHPRLF